MVVHRRLDSTDSRWVERASKLRDNPLEHNLGFFDFGKYHKAAEGDKHAFERVGELMGFELDSGDEDSEDEVGDEENNDQGQANDKGNENDDQAQRTEQNNSLDQSDNAAQGSSPSPSHGLQLDVGKKIDSTCPLTPSTLRKHLARDILKSKDKLLLIKRRRPSHQLASWHLVQVDEEETNWKKAKAEGVYHVRFFVRRYVDSSKMKVRECAYWPEIHEFKRDGETMGPIVPTKPSKVEHLLSTKPHRYMWYQDTINLFDAMITGPFEFEDGFHVPEAAWKELLAVADVSKIYVGAVNRIVPLDKPDRMDKDVTGGVHSHLTLRWNIFNGTG